VAHHVGVDVLLIGAPRLARWHDRRFHPMDRRPGDREDVYERDLAAEPPGEPGERFRRIAAAIRRYDIFGRELVEGIVMRPIERGDTVGIHYRGMRVVRLFFAARVVETFDGAAGGWWRAGFRYRTLVGHPELGEETFAVEKHLATGRLRVALRSWSRPGTLIARMFSPVVRRLQVHASHRALDHLAAVGGASGTS
jgi:uncharacterized protein (UPF0548 family)